MNLYIQLFSYGQATEHGQELPKALPSLANYGSDHHLSAYTKRWPLFNALHILNSLSFAALLT
jgi:hypothetical protein